MNGVRNSRNPLDCSVLTHSPNSRVSGFVPSAKTSFTPKTLCEIASEVRTVKEEI
jgi:hypothetical protein